MGKGRGGLPDRWLDYVAVGRQIKGVPIIACKVPLKEELLRHKIGPEQWFTPDILVERVPNVGCIVDLTATDRYYNPTVFTRQGIQHEKIFCAGHVIPNITTVQRFFQVLDDFLLSVDSRGKILMVHCTHGLNRTGYLVSRYMVERRGFQPSEAIEAFNEARGHKIERSNYLEHLHQMIQQVCASPVPLFSERPRSKEHRDYGERETRGEGRGRPNVRQRELPPAPSGYNSYERHEQPVERNQPRSNYPSFSYEPARSERLSTWTPQWKPVPTPVDIPPPPLPANSWNNRPSSHANHGRSQPSTAGSIPINQGRHHQPAPPRDHNQKPSYSYNERPNFCWTVTPTEAPVQFSRDRSRSHSRPDLTRPPPSLHHEHYEDRQEDRQRSTSSYAFNDRPTSGSFGRSAENPVVHRSSSLRSFEDRPRDTRPSSASGNNHHRPPPVHHLNEPPARANRPSRSEPAPRQEGATGQSGQRLSRRKNARNGGKNNANRKAPTNSS